ncbi:hypothetical protein PTI98_007778 [Pleurotus ostreatus]|nr:hypothetical protein PTI98_007778 [Pleurotus ostreatus]
MSSSIKQAFFALQTLTIGIVHCLYALRVWKLSKREHFLVKTVPFLLAILIGVSFGRPYSSFPKTKNILLTQLP